MLLKGATTLVVTEGEPVRSQADAPPWLATAGAGDVLSGVIGALLAAGLSPHDAASLGALVHGVTADRVSGGGPLRALAVAHGIRPDGARPAGPGTVGARLKPATRAASRTRSPASGPPRRTARLHR